MAWKAFGALRKKLLWTPPVQSLHGSPMLICQPVGEVESASKPGFVRAGDGAGWVVTVVTATVSTVLVSVSVACKVSVKAVRVSS